MHERQAAWYELRKHVSVQHHDHANQRRQRHRMPENKSENRSSLPT